MKRSDALAPLSRDHHVALEVALRLRRATDADIAVAAARVRAEHADIIRRAKALDDTDAVLGAAVEAAERERD